jgi:autotransporter-associated beta strand protein
LNLANNLAVAATHTVTVDNHGNVLTLGGVISGNGVLTAAGAGSLILGGVNNTYAGGTVLNAGTVGISADGAAAGAPGNLGVVPATMTPNNLLFNGGDLLATATLILETNRGLGIGSVASASTATTTAFLDAAAGQTLTATPARWCWRGRIRSTARMSSVPAWNNWRIRWRCRTARSITATRAAR